MENIAEGLTEREKKKLFAMLYKQEFMLKGLCRKFQVAETWKTKADSEKFNAPQIFSEPINPYEN